MDNNDNKLIDNIKKYICQICKEVFDCSDTLSDHKCSIELCNFCKKKFDSKIILIQHILDKHEESLKACELCNVSFINSTLLIIHKKRHSTRKENILKCSICPRAFFNKLKLSSHEITHGMERSDGGFLLKNENIQTVVLPSPKNEYFGFEDLYTCNICSRSFKSNDILKRHLASHVKKNTCSECGISSMVDNFLEKHYLLCTKRPSILWNDKSLLQIETCKYCGKLIEKGFNYDRHVQTHLRYEEMRKYKCKYCRCRYVHPTDLFAHFKSHHKTKTPFLCTCCNLPFANPNAFSMHIKRTHDNYGSIRLHDNHSIVYDDTLSDCDKSLSMSNDFSEAFCNVSNNQKSNSKYEITGIKSFMAKNIVKTGQKTKCNVCGRKVALEAIKRHTAGHLKKYSKLLKCHLCTQYFRTASKRDWHVNNHFKYDKNLCFCGAKYNSVTDLQNHMETCDRNPNVSDSIADSDNIFIINVEKNSCLILETSAENLDYVTAKAKAEESPLSFLNKYTLLFPDNITVKRITPAEAILKQKFIVKGTAVDVTTNYDNTINNSELKFTFSKNKNE